MAIKSRANDMNEQNLKPIDSTSVAREMQKKSAEKRKQNTAEKKLIRERILAKMGEDDWDEVIAGIIKRAKKSDKAFEILRDTIGEKPTDKVEMTGAQEKFAEVLDVWEKKREEK